MPPSPADSRGYTAENYVNGRPCPGYHRTMPAKGRAPKRPGSARALSELAAWLGRRGGKARLKTMTKEERKAAARKAARARWAKKRGE